MRRLTTIAVCTALLAACGGTSDSATTDTRDAATTDVTATSDQADLSTTTTALPAATVATTAAPTSEVPTTVADTTTTTVAVAGLTALAIETAGEQAALDTAATDMGRAWATGNPSGTERAAGDPFLFGYEVRLDDGVTQHQVLVIDGAVVSYFGIGADVLEIPGSVADLWLTIAPETPRQQAAVDAARAFLVATAPGATNGGILAYRVAFPATGPIPTGQQYPGVAVFAVPFDPSNPFASGGSEMR